MNFFNTMRVGTRLALGFGLLLAATLVISVLSLYELTVIGEKVDDLANNRMVKVQKFNEVKGNFQTIASDTRTVALIEDIQRAKVEADKIAPLRERNSKLLAELEPRITLPRGVELFKTIQQTRNAYYQAIDESIRLGLTGDASDAKRATELLLGDVARQQEILFHAVDESLAMQNEEAVSAAQAARDTIAFAQRVVLILLVLAAVIGSFIAVAIARGLTRALGAEPDEVSLAVNRVADGDLTQELQLRTGDRGSIMSAVKRMQESLRKTVSTVRQGSDSVATASAQIAQGNQDLSARTESQASALEETAASMEELGSTVKQNADNARQANQLAQSASTVAVQGGEVVAQVVGTMKGISESSRKIADIISVIDGIAFQTNILALNAAVEAARAGEQGRGFAVVAGEVRTLASRSAEAAKEIKQLITDSVGRVEQGTALVDQAGQTMNEVVASIRRVTDIMGEISAASAEQSAGVSQVGEAVTQMDQATQQNAALVEEMAAAANSLRSQAQELVQAVSVFQLTEGQASPRAAAVPAHRPAPAPAQAPVRPKITGARASAPAPAPPQTHAVVAKPASSPREGEWESF
ncbi:MAG: methyl-accepting chemotaxis protein [Hylemonella sp.]|uniref:methyl-accepting chemotaxis protein n=1 Tax=Hylemonella sp. TaxID=2066020 RepID=UPI00391C7D6F